MREQKAKAALEAERKDKKARVSSSDKKGSNYRGKIEDGSCFKSPGEEGWVDPKKELEPYENVFLASTAYLSNMNPDDLENIIKNFLTNIDTEALEVLVIKEDKYKIRYHTIQDIK